MHISSFNQTKRLAGLLLALWVMTSQLGCVRRRMTIRSDPPGAVVYVDERRIGVTPVSASFTYYGTRDIQLVKDGYETVKEKHRVAAPWYQYPVVDFFAENLWPLETRDERVLEFDLPPMKTAVPTQVMERAEQLRSQTQQGLTTPLMDSGGARPAGQMVPRR